MKEMPLQQWCEGQLSGPLWDFAGDAVVKNLPAKAGISGDRGSTPGSGRSPGGRNGTPLQYCFLENPMDRGAWWATVHGVTKSLTGLNTHAYMLWGVVRKMWSWKPLWYGIPTVKGMSAMGVVWGMERTRLNRLREVPFASIVTALCCLDLILSWTGLCRRYVRRD